MNAIAALASEQEQVSLERVLVQHLHHRCAQPVERAAHVDRRQPHEDPRVRRQRQHRSPASSARIPGSAPGVPTSICIDTPFGRRTCSVVDVGGIDGILAAGVGVGDGSRVMVTGISAGASPPVLAASFASRHFHKLNNPGASP
jgi:hypothetical protein